MYTMKQVPLEKGRPIPHIKKQKSQRTLLVRRQQTKYKNVWKRMGQQVPENSKRRNFWALETGRSMQNQCAVTAVNGVRMSRTG